MAKKQKKKRPPITPGYGRTAFTIAGLAFAVCALIYAFIGIRKSSLTMDISAAVYGAIGTVLLIFAVIWGVRYGKEKKNPPAENPAEETKTE